MDIWSDRDESIAHYELLFGYSHLPQHLQVVSQGFYALAERLLDQLHDGIELEKALAKLLEAKDAAVRQAMIDAL